MSQEVEVVARDLIAAAFANRTSSAIPVSKIVGNVLGLPAVVNAIAKWQAGDESPSGNAMIDRTRVVDVVRREAARAGMAIPEQPVVKDMTIARHVSRQMKRLGLPVSRSGRVLPALPMPDSVATTPNTANR